MKRRSREEWQSLISEQLSSGETQEEFCRARQLSISSFYSWKQKLRKSASSFVELGVAAESSKHGAELELPGGAVLRFSW